ncbi:MAG: metallophosphoesterase [Bryobacteraceae bacterium]|jgi:predicted phosphodiesterase
MAYGQYRLQFLHISDLHAKGPLEKEPWRRRRVLGDAWLRNLETLTEEEGPVQFVFFTGDAAQSGKPEEYAAVTDFFRALCEELGIGFERLFVVPGNHDIDRDVQAGAWESTRMRLAATTDLLGVSRWMNGIGAGAPLGFEDSWKSAILERQHAYRTWVRDDLRRAESAGLGYRSTVELPGWAHPIQVVGLDTAWLCGDDADSGRLLLTENQVGRHLTGSNGDPLPGLRIVLMHHPLHELADGMHARRLLADYADLVLRGHLHQTEMVEWIDPDRRLRELAAGSLYEGGLADTYGNSCQLVRLELDSDLRPIEAMVRFRSFSPKGGHWYDNNSLYRESREGRITWTFGVPVPRKPNPFSPWTPRPEHCFGRAGVFRRLETAFDERRSMWLVGDWRIGKTVILLAWEKRLRERGIIVKLVSGQGPAGVSVRQFVETVTGLDSPPEPDDAANLLTAWIDAVSSSGLPPVVLVDEVESVVQSCDVRFFDRLRDLLGRICLVFSSREAPDEVFTRNNKASPITNRMETAWIGLLEPGGADATIRLGAGQFGPGDTDLMHRWCGEHSFFLQLFGSGLVDSRRAGTSPDDALADLKRQAPMHFRQLWKTLPGAQQQALRDAARGVPSQAGVLKQRGLLRDDGTPFGEIFAAWLREEIAS